MPVRVTIDIYSGWPNPVVELEGTEAQDVLERLKPTEPLVADEAERAATPILGYRGLIIEQTGATPSDKDLRHASGRPAANWSAAGWLIARPTPTSRNSFSAQKATSRRLRRRRSRMRSACAISSRTSSSV